MAVTNTGAVVPLAAMSTSNRSGATVAFESIEGPPEALFRKLVDQLNQEAAARSVTVVSREQPAQYRILGYVAAHVQGKRTTISWAWDIFDANYQRTMRLSGEVPGGAGGWNGADDQVLTRVARDGMERLATFLASPVATAALRPAGPDGRPDVAYAPADTDALGFLSSAGTP